MKKIITITLLALAFAGCRKESSQPCSALKQAIINNDITAVKNEINRLGADLLPVVTASDEWGHGENTKKLVERLQECGIQSGNYCYACIKTLPPQSEIFVSFTQDGNTVKRTIDLSADKNRSLYFINMHE